MLVTRNYVPLCSVNCHNVWICWKKTVKDGNFTYLNAFPYIQCHQSRPQRVEQRATRQFWSWVIDISLSFHHWYMVRSFFSEQNSANNTTRAKYRFAYFPPSLWEIKVFVAQGLKGVPICIWLCCIIQLVISPVSALLPMSRC